MSAWTFELPLLLNRLKIKPSLVYLWFLLLYLTSGNSVTRILRQAKSHASEIPLFALKSPWHRFQMKSHLYEAKFFVIPIIAFALYCGLILFTSVVSLKDVHCILLPCSTCSSHLTLIADFVPILHTYSSCWGWYCPFRFARTYTAKTTPKCPSLELADSRATAPQWKEQTEHSCLIPRLSNHWPLFLWHPISDTTLLKNC